MKYTGFTLLLALVCAWQLYLKDGVLWLRQDGGPPQAVTECCPAALPAQDRALLEAGLEATSQAALTAALENFCS